MLWRISIASLFLIFLFQQPVFGFSKARKEYTKKVEFKPGGELSVKSDDGDIEIIGWDKNEVFVEAEITAHAFSRSQAEAKVERVRVRVQESEAFIRVSSHGPSNTEVAYIIHVPNKISVTCRTDDGKIKIENVDGAHDLRTEDGDIYLHQIQGKIRARSDDGEVQFSGKLENLDVSTEDGNIIGSFEPEGSTFIKTDDGDVELEIVTDEENEPAIYIRTDDGRVHSDFPVWTERSHMRQSSKKVKFDVRTNDGNVRLTRK
ncbi:MAG: hypothetical protein DWQ05_08005 [Calditrichaeota bacterium]|nr:MAG: hypothetical protein DWQ05_08005 [Calditrichota bacterium]